MLVRQITLPATNGEPHRIYLLSDAHVGSSLCDEKALTAWIAGIAADSQARVLITGDLIHAIGKGDRRLDLGNLAPWIRNAAPEFAEDVIGLQCDRAVAMLEPIADKIDGYVSGNHEIRPRSWYGRSITAGICRALDIRDAYLGAQGWVAYSFKITRTRRRRLAWYVHHGYSAGRTLGGQTAMLERMLRDHDCDVAACGHSHETVIFPRPQMRLDTKTGRLVQRQRWGIMAGAWERATMDGSDGWTDEKGLSPKALGRVVLEYNPITAVSEVSATG